MALSYAARITGKLRVWLLQEKETAAGEQRIQPKNYAGYNQWDKFVKKDLDKVLEDFDEQDRQVEITVVVRMGRALTASKGAPPSDCLAQKSTGANAVNDSCAPPR